MLFQWSLFYAESARNACLSALRGHPVWGWLVLPVAGAVLGALVGWGTRRYAPEASGSGIPHVKAVQSHLRALHWTRVLPVKFIGGVLGIGFVGLSLGREGPTVQMGAALGQGLAHILRVPRRSEAHLVVCGAGAGLAAAFNAPLAGFVFVIEELRRELSAITYGTALIAAIAADIVTRSLTGQLPSFHAYGYPTPPLGVLPLAAALGCLCGLLGVAFNRTLLWSVARMRQWKAAPGWAHTALAGCIMGLVAWWLPEAVGGGHQTGEHILRGEYTSLSFIVILLAVKFALTMLSYASGAPGGIFAPLLVLGALAGMAVGHFATIWFPSLAQNAAAFAVLGMAATFTAIVRAPLTGIVLITEMTGNYDQLFVVAIACLSAYMVAEAMRDTPIYDALLEQDLHKRGQPAAVSEPVLIDLVVEAGSSADGHMLRDLDIPEGCSLVIIKRAGQEVVPTESFSLLPGDGLTIIVAGDSVGVIHELEAMTHWKP